MGALSLAEVRERLEDIVESLARGEAIEIVRDHGPTLRVVAETRSRQPIDFDEMRRLRALSKPHVDPDGLSFVERLRRDDEL